MTTEELANPQRHPHQRYINKLLRSGVMWSLLWLGGIGSAVALARGLEARKLLEEGGDVVEGRGGAWWCIIFGAIGVLLWLPLWLLGIWHHGS